MGLTRRQFIRLLGLGGGGLATGYSVYHMGEVEPDWFEVTEKSVHTNRLSTPLRILHLSDLHASSQVPYSHIEAGIDQALTQNADICVLTGDFITWDLVNTQEYIRILKKLSDRMPTFACIGNHDGGQWASTTRGYDDFSLVEAMLKDAGIAFLFNQSHPVSIGQHSITMIGLGDLWSNDTKPELVLTKQRESDGLIIVLVHNPDVKDLIKEYDWDLVCCGHTHGGQLVVPLLGWRPFLPVKDKSFPEGLLSWGQRHIHITRGIGNLHGARFNCRPEISILNVM